MSRAVAVTFDYRCPFAYNGHTAVIAALRAGADLDVRFLPFSLDQVHLEEDATPVWEQDPADWGSGVLALLYGVAVRDGHPDRFLDAHLAIFAIRHLQGGRLNDEDALRAAVASAGLDPAAVAQAARRPETMDTLRREHTEAVERWAVFGVPTFLEGDEAVFIRFMEPNCADDIERALDLLAWTRLNEFKRTRIPR